MKRFISIIFCMFVAFSLSGCALYDWLNFNVEKLPNPASQPDGSAKYALEENAMTQAEFLQLISSTETFLDGNVDEKTTYNWQNGPDFEQVRNLKMPQLNGDNVTIQPSLNGNVNTYWYEDSGNAHTIVRTSKFLSEQNRIDNQTDNKEGQEYEHNVYPYGYFSQTIESNNSITFYEQIFYDEYFKYGDTNYYTNDDYYQNIYHPEHDFVQNSTMLKTLKFISTSQLTINKDWENGKPVYITQITNPNAVNASQAIAFDFSFIGAEELQTITLEFRTNDETNPTAITSARIMMTFSNERLNVDFLPTLQTPTIHAYQGYETRSAYFYYIEEKLPLDKSNQPTSDLKIHYIDHKENEYNIYCVNKTTTFYEHYSGGGKGSGTSTYTRDGFVRIYESLTQTDKAEYGEYILFNEHQAYEKIFTKSGYELSVIDYDTNYQRYYELESKKYYFPSPYGIASVDYQKTDNQEIISISMSFNYGDSIETQTYVYTIENGKVISIDIKMAFNGEQSYHETFTLTYDFTLPTTLPPELTTVNLYFD